LDRRAKLQTALISGINSADVECMQGVLAQMRQNARNLLADEDFLKK